MPPSKPFAQQSPFALKVLEHPSPHVSKTGETDPNGLGLLRLRLLRSGLLHGMVSEPRSLHGLNKPKQGDSSCERLLS